MAEYINTNSIQDFLKKVEAASRSNTPSVILDITTAKVLSSTLALVMTRLAGDYETILGSLNTTPQSVFLDGGTWDNPRPEKNTPKNS